MFKFRRAKELHNLNSLPKIVRWLNKSNGIPRQAEVAQGVPGRLRPRIFSTFGTTRLVGRQPNSPATFTPGEIPGTHFSEAESTSGPMVLSEGTTEKIPSDTTGDRSRDHSTSSATPGPCQMVTSINILWLGVEHAWDKYNLRTEL